MTRKDYVLLAESFNAIVKKIDEAPFETEEQKNFFMQGVLASALRLGITLKLENPRFELERFITACGLVMSPEEQKEE